MKKKILMSLFTIAIVCALIGGGVAAYFTSSASSNPNIFTAGNLVITLTDPGNPGGNFSNMKPGDTVTFTFTAANGGSLPLDYTVVTVLSGNLTVAPNPCQVTSVTIDGTVTTTDSLSIVGQGDASDVIVVSVTMPWAAGNWYQGKTGNLAVTVNATPSP